jgi:hypothetical protein
MTGDGLKPKTCHNLFFYKGGAEWDGFGGGFSCFGHWFTGYCGKKNLIDGDSR